MAHVLYIGFIGGGGGALQDTEALHMSGLKFWVLALGIWGTTAWATLSDTVGGEYAQSELQTISSWMAHLSQLDPNIKIATLYFLENRDFRREILSELALLGEVMRGESALPPGSLMYITCSNIVCGGSDGGRCLKCSGD